MNPNPAKKQAFIPAEPTGWVIKTVQEIIRAELDLNDKLFFEEQNLDLLRQLPKGAGIVLTSNHADETDPRVCLDLSRRCGKRFITMCNREAFDEMFGLAGWVLRRLGFFSVRRGAHDTHAKSYATDVVKDGRDVLVIFPEGEIFYLNEKVQPFHSGAIDICLRSIVEKRESDPSWTAYIVPMVIKYDYSTSIEQVLEKRIAKMEAQLFLQSKGKSLAQRLWEIQSMLLQRQDVAYQIELPPDDSQSLTQKIIITQNAILSDIENRHPQVPLSSNTPAIDKAWRLEAEISEAMNEQSGATGRMELKHELASLREVAHLSSWRPQYYLDDPSPDRLAECLLKVEREFYGIKRPRPLAKRNVMVRIAEPLEMGKHVSDYLQDSHTVRHNLTRQLHEQMQSLIDKLITHSANSA